MFAGFENPIHILFVVVIAMLVFGPSQLPKIARSAGKHARDARDGIAVFKEEFEAGMHHEEEPRTLQQTHPTQSTGTTQNTTKPE